jgi:hypothetical protein
MEELAISVLLYALWPLLTLAVAALWIAATLDIIRHRRGEAFSNVKLLCMATLVSVAAVIAIGGIGAVLGGQWFEAVARASSNEIQTNKQDGEVPARSYLFSFGLEHASYVTPANSMSAKEQGQRD